MKIVLIVCYLLFLCPSKVLKFSWFSFVSISMFLPKSTRDRFLKVVNCSFYEPIFVLLSFFF